MALDDLARPGGETTDTSPRVGDPDLTGRRAARRLALELAMLVGRPTSLVVVAHPVFGTELTRASAGNPPFVDGSALLELVMASDPVVCDAARLHGASLRRLSQHWRCSRVLFTPCFFGHDLVAVAVAPVAERSDRRGLEVAARGLAERFAAQVIGTRLFANGRRDLALGATG